MNKKDLVKFYQNCKCLSNETKKLMIGGLTNE